MRSAGDFHCHRFRFITGLVAVVVVVIADVEVDALATVALVAGLGSSRPFLYMPTDGGSFLLQNSLHFFAIYIDLEGVCSLQPECDVSL